MVESWFTLYCFPSFQQWCVFSSCAVDSVPHCVANSQSKPTVAFHQFSTLVLGMYTQQVKSKALFVPQHSAGFQRGEMNLK